jgi:hypothetical protein
MQIAKERAVVFRQILYFGADELQVGACVFMRRVEPQGAFVAYDCIAGLAIAPVSVS